MTPCGLHVRFGSYEVLCCHTSYDGEYIATLHVQRGRQVVQFIARGWEVYDLLGQSHAGGLPLGILADWLEEHPHVIEIAPGYQTAPAFGADRLWHYLRHGILGEPECNQRELLARQRSGY